MTSEKEQQHDSVESMSEAELARAILEAFGVGFSTLPYRLQQRRPGPDNDLMRTLWRALTHEIYIMLCTKHKKYAKARATVKKGAKHIGPILALFLTDKFGVGAGFAGLLSDLALKTLLPLGINTFCTMRAHEYPQVLTPLEEKGLATIASKKGDAQAEQ